MSSGVGNADFSSIQNYISDVAVTVMFGLGYYLFKGLKKKHEENDDFSDPEAGLKNLKGKLEGALQRWQYAKSIEEFNELIKTNYNKDGIQDPFSIINLMNKNGIIPNIDTYNALLLNCYSHDNEQYAEILKEEILDPCGPVTANNFTLNVLIKGLNLKYKNIIKNLKITNPNFNKQEVFLNFDHELIKLLQTLEHRNIYMDLIGQNTILDSLVDQERLNEAWNQYISMKRKFKPDMITYSTILRGIKTTPEISADWLDKAFLILEEAKIKNEIDEQFLNSLLDSCVKFNRIDKAESIFIENKNSTKSKLTEHSYCIMIKGYAKIYKLENAEKMFNELKSYMQEKKLSVVTYGAMLNAYTRCKNIEKAENLVREMEENMIEVNSFIYSTLINGYRISRKYDKALALADKLIEVYKNKLHKETTDHFQEAVINTSNKEDNSTSNEVSLNIVFFNAILDCCVESNKIEKMNEIFNFINDNQNGDNFAKIDMITYSIIIKGYAKSGKIEKVTEIYSYLRRREDFKLDEMLYNTIIDCYAKNLDEENALKIYNDMKVLNIPISVVTYGVMIKLYANFGNSTKAFELFDECIKNDIKPSVIIYQMLIKLQIKAKFIDRAITLFKNMINNGIKADQIIYELIIKGCLEQNREKEAGEYIVAALYDNVKIENYIIANFVDRLQNNETNFTHSEKAEIVQKLIEAIPNKCSAIELQSFNTLKKMQQSHDFHSSDKNKVSNVSFTPHTSIYNSSNSTPSSLVSSPSSNSYNVSSPTENKSTFNRNAKQNYIFNSSQGISDLKGFYKNYVTVPINNEPKQAYNSADKSNNVTAPTINYKFNTGVPTYNLNNYSNNNTNTQFNNLNNKKKPFNTSGKGIYNGEKSIYG